MDNKNCAVAQFLTAQTKPQWYDDIEGILAEARHVMKEKEVITESESADLVRFCDKLYLCAILKEVERNYWSETFSKLDKRKIVVEAVLISFTIDQAIELKRSAFLAEWLRVHPWLKTLGLTPQTPDGPNGPSF